jgi:hypothetical protein
MTKVWYLRNTGIFRGLSDEDVRMIDRHSLMQQIRRGQAIYLQGAPASHVYILKKVATFLLRSFGLEESARSRMQGLGVDTPWEAFAAVRAPIYAKMLENPEVMSKEQWPRNIDLLKEARRMIGGRNKDAKDPTGETRRK